MKKFLLIFLLLISTNVCLAQEALNQDGINVLTLAVRENDIAKVARILKSGVNPNSKNLDGSTALMWIGYFYNPTEESKLAIAKLLIKNGADFNAKDNYDQSVLHYAVTYDLGKVVSYLLSIGAKDPATKKSALVAAIEGKKTDIVKKIISAGIDPNYSDAIWSAMHYESEQIREIILNSAKFNKNNQLWAQYAAQEGQIITLKTLIDRHAEINKPGEGSFSALLYAIDNNKTESAKLLISAGAKLEIRNDSGYGSMNGETAICLASRKGNLEIVNALIAAKADVNANCDSVAAAVKNNNIDILKALIAAGADLNDRYTGHWNAIFICAQTDQAEIANELIKGKINVNTRDGLDSTPLMIAASKGSLKMIRLLFENGANLEDVNSRLPMSDFRPNFKGTALQWAIYYKQLQAAALLKELGAQSDGSAKEVTIN